MYTENDERLIHTIGLGLLDGIGPINARRLVAYCGSPREVFSAEKNKLLRTPGIGEITARTVNGNVLKRAEQELDFIRKNRIRAFTYLDEGYPQRLRNCEDAPLVLFSLGHMDPEKERMVSIVGTRSPSEKGRQLCEELVENFAGKNITIVSGLAYGIDICAHRAAVKHNIPTIAVLAHGLDRIYPGSHRSTAEKMLTNGGLLTEFISGTNPDRENFPKRNRIVAGLCDATIVIETAIKGGSIITAMLANDYNRDVFAFPGRPGDEKSAGCNRLIKLNRAALAENAEDILRLMGWNDETKNKSGNTQFQLFRELDPDEEKIVTLLQENGPTSADAISIFCNWPMSKVSATLLTMEFKSLVKSMPGKVYALI